MNFTDNDVIHGYHAHVYYDADSIDAARTLCQEAGRRFALTVGRIRVYRRTRGSD